MKGPFWWNKLADYPAMSFFFVCWQQQIKIQMQISWVGWSTRNKQPSSLNSSPPSSFVSFSMNGRSALPTRFEEGNACSSRRPVWLTPLKLSFFGAAKSHPLSRLSLPFLHRGSFVSMTLVEQRNYSRRCDVSPLDVWIAKISTFLLIFATYILNLSPAFNRSFMVILEI